MERNGMVQLQLCKPKVVNGVFAVPKDVYKHRLIIDARPANAVLKDPPHVLLPNPGHLADLSFQQNTPLFVCKSDMDNFYHRLGMPAWLHQYFGLPQVVRNGVRLWPVVVSLPMGWSHSVFIGQAIHEGLAQEAGLTLENSFQRSEDVEVCDFRHGQYIDDFFALGSNRELLGTRMMAAVEAGEAVDLPARESKRTMPGTEDPTTVLGLEISEQGVIRPSFQKLPHLITLSLKLLRFRSWNSKLIERLLGGWVGFFCYVARCFRF